MALTLKQKIFHGYIMMTVFTLVVGGYAIWSLQELNKISTDIIFNYVKTKENITKLNDSILAQDLYEKRFLTLSQPDAETQFWSRSKEFREVLGEIAKRERYPQNILDSIEKAHEQYNLLFSEESSLVKSGKIREAAEVSSQDLRLTLSKIMASIRDLDFKVQQQQNLHISSSNSLGKQSLMITIILSTFSLVFGILFATLITTHLTKAIEQFKEATQSIQSGNFDNVPDIQGADELADLAISFKEMSVRLKELEAINLDANPLTKLPGNLAIEKELLTRLNETQKFSFCLIDLDNFKAFSDRYGYSKGSDVLKWVGDLLLTVKKEYGSPDDFVGHIGGDDFVIICSPERVHSMCSRIIEEFDRGIVEHYDPEDVKKGFIISVDRHDKPAIFGIMTVSIAVVNTDRTLIREPKEVAQKVAELKSYAKTFTKSIYIMDRRRAR